MATVTKTWVFTGSAENLADAGNSGVTFAHDGTDNAVKFTQTVKSVTETEFARKASTGEDWEDWGVPASATVTAVQITAWTEKLVTSTKLSSHSIKARIIGSGGSTVHSAGDLLNVSLGTSPDGSYQAGAAGTSRAVDGGSQASTTDVRLELEYTVTTSSGGGDAAVDQRFDDIELTITYTPAPSTGAAAGVATATATGASTALATGGDAAGVATVTGVGGALGIGVGAAAGSASCSGVGYSTTSTARWLRDNSAAHVAFCLVFDGVDLIYTTTSDTTGIVTAYSGTDWTTVKSGLDILGNMQQSIKIFDAELEIDTMDFTLVDHDGTIRTTVTKNHESGDNTILLTNHTPTSTSLGVEDVSEFASSGHVYIGHERIAYSGVTNGGVDADTFDTLTRGKNAVFAIDGGTRFGRNHRTNGLKSRVHKPVVSEMPRTWYNRLVGLFAHHKDQTGVWSTKTYAELIWAGRIIGYKDNGDASFTFTCQSIKADLTQSVLADQYVAEQAKSGITINSETARFSLEWNDGTNSGTATTTLTTGDYTYDLLVSKINQQLNTWRTGSTTHATHMWSCSVEPLQDGWRTVFRVKHQSGSSFATRTLFRIYLHRNVFDWLGFDPMVVGAAGVDVQVPGVCDLKAVPGAASRYEAISQYAPKLYYDHSDLGLGISNSFSTANRKGTWVDQPTEGIGVEVPDGTDGFVLYDGVLFAVSRTSGASADIFTVTKRWGELKYGSAESGTSPVLVRLGEAEVPSIRQVWIERGPMGALLLKTMLSTGVSGYNHTNYDKYGYGFGLALPAGMIDIESFSGMDDPFEVFVEKPTSFAEILEAALSATGRTLVFRNGKLSATFPGFELEAVNDIVDLDEDTKADPGDRSTIEYSTQGIINQVTLQIKKSASGVWFDPARTISVQNMSSISDFGKRRSVTVDGRGILDERSWADYVAGPVLAYFGRPVGIIRRSINHRMVHLRPGDIVKITDDYLIDPTAGTRGVSGLAGWVRSTDFDWGAGGGNIEVVFLPEHDASKYAKYSPSAMVDSTATNGGLDAGTLKTFTTEDRRFVRSGDQRDASFFSVGDKVHILEVSTSGSPNEWDRTVDTVVGNQITVTSAIGSPAWDSSKKYIIESQAKSAAETEQRSNAYIASSNNRSTGLAVRDANLWTGPYNEFIVYNQTVDYSIQFVRPDASIATTGEPLSTHKIWLYYDSLNNMLAYKTRQVLVNQMLLATVAQTGTTAKLAYGPILLPLYGINRLTGAGTSSPTEAATRKLKVKARMVSDSGGGTVATATFKTCGFPVRGSSETSLTYVGSTSSVNVTVTGTTATWSDWGELTPIVSPEEGTPVTWLTVEIYSDNVARTATLSAVSVIEAELS